MFYIVNHNFSDSVLSILQLFFFGEDFCLIEEIQDDITLKSYIKNNFAICEIFQNKNLTFTYNQNILSDEPEEIKRAIKISVYKAILNIRNLKMPWGILTGIRPAKKINELRKKFSDSEIKTILKEKYLVFDEKIDLAINVASIQKNVIKNNNNNKISVYIGIPFCPTRCIYCSFPSYSISQYTNKIDLYIDALEKEIISLKSYIRNFEIENIYIGGGTPTSLNEYQFERFLNIIQNNLKKPTLEYTIEAGRADTITKNKLKLMKKFNATRISINPQTMNDKTLKLIGRNHLENEFLEAFYLAREIGLNNINCDIILGLLEEGEKELFYTLQKLLKLNPESLTMHTLAIKRASKLKENLKNFNPNDFYTMENMINLTKKYAEKMGMYPYYMYRQKNMIGNFENVGYCKPNLECIYNIQIMEEKQSIIAFGSGASTKFYFENQNRLERVFNVKNVEHYINRIDEMIERKKVAFDEFFKEV